MSAWSGELVLFLQSKRVDPRDDKSRDAENSFDMKLGLQPQLTEHVMLQTLMMICRFAGKLQEI